MVQDVAPAAPFPVDEPSAPSASLPIGLVRRADGIHIDVGLPQPALIAAISQVFRAGYYLPGLNYPLMIKALYGVGPEHVHAVSIMHTAASEAVDEHLLAIEGVPEHVTAFEKNRVSVPAVVKEGHLAPFDELVWLTTPTPTEEDWLTSEALRSSPRVRASRLGPSRSNVASPATMCS